MSGVYYRDAQAALICFNLCDRSSFNSIPKWVEELNKHFAEDEKVVKCLVGCQSDEIQRATIKMEEINECTKKYGFIDYMQTSAKTGENVQKLFKLVTDQIIRMEQEARKQKRTQSNASSRQRRNRTSSKYS